MGKDTGVWSNSKVLGTCIQIGKDYEIPDKRRII